MEPIVLAIIAFITTLLTAGIGAIGYLYKLLQAAQQQDVRDLNLRIDRLTNDLTVSNLERDEARRQVAELSRQLEAAQEKIAHLESEIARLHRRRGLRFFEGDRE